MHIDKSGIQGLMPKDRLDSEDICTIFIQVGPQGMPEGMAGKPPWPAKEVFMFVDVSGKEKGIDRPVWISLFRKEPAHRSARLEPVLCENIKSISGEGRKAFCLVLGMANTYFHITAADIIITQMTDLANAQAGRIHKCKHSLLFQIRY